MVTFHGTPWSGGSLLLAAALALSACGGGQDAPSTGAPAPGPAPGPADFIDPATAGERVMVGQVEGSAVAPVPAGTRTLAVTFIDALLSSPPLPAGPIASLWVDLDSRKTVGVVTMKGNAGSQFSGGQSYAIYLGDGMAPSARLLGPGVGVDLGASGSPDGPQRPFEVQWNLDSPYTLTGNFYVAGQDIPAYRIAAPSPAVVGQVTFDSGHPAALADIAGSWTTAGGSLTVSRDGALVAPARECNGTLTGTVAPRPSGRNFFDVNLKGAGACAGGLGYAAVVQVNGRASLFVSVVNDTRDGATGLYAYDRVAPAAAGP